VSVQIIHGGQTGVDRGAHFGALAHGFTVGGFMPADGSDESGPIPRDVARYLWHAPGSGSNVGARTRMNLKIAHALLVVVEDRTKPHATPGTKLTLDYARQIDLKARYVVDTDTPESMLVEWLRAVKLQRGPLAMNLMIAGPRASLWPEAESVAFSILASVWRAIGLAP
jgi:hypothetical protein